MTPLDHREILAAAEDVRRRYLAALPAGDPEAEALIGETLRADAEAVLGQRWRSICERYEAESGPVLPEELRELIDTALKATRILRSSAVRDFPDIAASVEEVKDRIRRVLTGDPGEESSALTNPQPHGAARR